MAGFEVRQLGPQRFAVFQGGAQVSAISRNMLMAEDKMVALENRAKLAARTERSCLRCSTKFMSEGPHNRMCNRCRATADSVFTGAV